MPAAAPSSTFTRLLETVRAGAELSALFGPISLKSGRTLVCSAKNSAEPAEYRVFEDAGRLWVSLVTANRWLSESIESDLLHTGDHLDELIEEELAEQNFEVTDANPVTFEHFRSEDMLYTFRSAIPVAPAAPDAARVALQWLLAYEACFRQLGDIDAGDEDE